MEQTSISIIFKGESERLDKALAKAFPTHSRTYFKNLISNQRVTINGKRVKKRIFPQIGDHIEISFSTPPIFDLSPENIPLKILFEDRDILCINKAAGMVVHPAPGHQKGTFVHALLYHCKGLSLPGERSRLGIVHRLDKDTSGILIAAKTKDAQETLIHLFSTRQVSKLYFAICIGNPGTKTIATSIGRSKENRKKMTTRSPLGKEAITEIQTLSTHGTLSLISARPITGRMHQIRVHLKEMGCPILGDPVYGCPKWNQKWGVTRQLLHAYSLKLPHPTLHSPLHLRADFPPDFEMFWGKMKK